MHQQELQVSLAGAVGVGALGTQLGFVITPGVRGEEGREMAGEGWHLGS